jgi:hypothetical protein
MHLCRTPAPEIYPKGHVCLSIPLIADISL